MFMKPFMTFVTIVAAFCCFFGGEPFAAAVTLTLIPIVWTQTDAIRHNRSIDNRMLCNSRSGYRNFHRSDGNIRGPLQQAHAPRSLEESPMRIAFLKESDHVVAVFVDEFHNRRISRDRVVYSMVDGYASAQPEYLDTLQRATVPESSAIRQSLGVRYPGEPLTDVDWRTARDCS